MKTIANRPTTLTRQMLICASLGFGSLLSASVTQAQEEDNIAHTFQLQMAEVAATLGLPLAESAVTVDSKGGLVAKVGLSQMKMLVARQHPDGSISYGHAGNGQEIQAFIGNKNTVSVEQ